MNANPFVRPVPLGFDKRGKIIYSVAGGSGPAPAPVDPAQQTYPVQPYVPAQPPATPPANYVTREDMEAAMERVRGEEKNKLYGQIEQQKAEIAALNQWRQEQEQSRSEEEARLAAEERRAEEAEMSSKELLERARQEWNDNLQQTTQTWEQRLEEEKAARESAQALVDKERRFNDLRAYAMAKVEERREDIAPQLVDWITGNSEEEIDLAVERAVATTNQIAQDLQGVPGQVLPGQVQQPPAPPVGTRPTGGPAGIDPTSQYQTLTPDQIKNMPMEQYAALRSRLGVGSSSQGQGMYG